MIRAQIARGWNSPTLTTLASTSVRILSLVGLLPLILTKFTEEDIAVWLLFSSVLGIQVIFELGFVATISRYAALALGGIGVSDLKSSIRESRKLNHSPNWISLLAVRKVGKRIFFLLAVVFGLFLATAGTAVVHRSVEQSSEPTAIWGAWVVLCVGSAISFYGRSYETILTGVQRVALLQRTLSLFGALSVVMSVVAVSLGAGVSLIIICQQSVAIISFVVKFRLANGCVRKLVPSRYLDENIPDIIGQVWPNAWRSGLGNLLISGFGHLAVAFLAQICSAQVLAKYLLAIRLIQVAGGLSQAPFYSQYPRFVNMRAKGDLHNLKKDSRSAMRKSYVVFLVAFGGGALFGDTVLKALSSKIDFPDPMLWSLIGLTYFLERWGAMHLQLYSTKNHIIWHIIGMIYALIAIVASLLLYILGTQPIYVVPIAMIFAHALGYLPFAVRMSCASIATNVWEFERKCTVPAFVCLGLIVMISSFS